MLAANRDINIAEALSKKEMCTEALIYAERATERENPISSYLLFKKSLLYEKCLEDGDEKIFDVLQKAVEKRPTYTRAWTNLGGSALSLISKKENKEELLETALFSYKKAAEISPNRYPTHSNLAFLLLKKEDFKGALDSAERCLQLKEEKECIFAKGVAFYLMKEEEKGKKFLEMARDMNHDIAKGLNFLIDHHIYLENYSAMIPLFLMLIEEEPKEAQHHSSIATAYKETGEYDKAEEHALKALELQPEAAPVVEEFLRNLPQ